MTTWADQLCSAVAKWLANTSFADAFVFGSVIHRDGSQFEPQRSDVDLISLFRPKESYLERWKSVIRASTAAEDLNLELLRTLGRQDASKPIASIVPVSDIELTFGLHKDGALQFFSHNDFLSITSGVTGPIGKEHIVQSAADEGALNSIREAQRARNKLLSVTPAGARQLQRYGQADPLPKAFVRCAAQTRWALVSYLPQSDRFDVNEGMLYALQLLVARRREDPAVNHLLERVVVRMGGRGEAVELDANDQLLLWEIEGVEHFV